MPCPSSSGDMDLQNLHLEANIKILNGHNFFVLDDIDDIDD